MTGENTIENAQAEFAKAQAARRAVQALAELKLYDDAASRLRQFAGLMGLRSQADHNRHFIIDEGGFAEELAKSNSLFQALEAFLAERGIRA